MYKAELEKARKEKLNSTTIIVLLRGRALLLGSLDEMV